jgi:hypothetical protein
MKNDEIQSLLYLSDKVNSLEQQLLKTQQQVASLRVLIIVLVLFFIAGFFIVSNT